MSTDLMISVSGVRGIVGQSLTPEVVLEFAQAFGRLVKGGRVVVGRDSRPSGEALKHAVFSGLLWSGCRPIDLGICPTPTIQVAVEDLKARGGIAVTASHNPAEWNALKFIGPRGTFLSEPEGRKLLAIHAGLHKGDMRGFTPSRRPGSVPLDSGAVSRHLERILPIADQNAVRARHFRVVLDCVSGAGGLLLIPLLERLRCKVTALHSDPTGEFPHEPEPLPENLKELCRRVKRERADLGLAVDPDGDRLALVSEKGEPLGEDQTLVLAARFVLSQNRGTVVANLSTTRALDDVAGQFHCRVLRTKVGEINVVEGMKKNRAVLGGEGNGGVIHPQVHYGRDAGVACALVLSLLAQSRRPLSEVIAGLPRYFMLKTKVHLKDPHAIWGELNRRLENQVPDRTDGLKVDWPDGWLHFRLSGTEPVLRVIVEATSEARMREIHRRAMDLLDH